MYFTGKNDPETELRRNRYSEKSQRSKFTEEIAATAADGDLYFSQRSPAHERYYVPVAEGEHGLPEAGLVCVTHRFRKSFDDIPGRWEEYDGGGNLVIKIDRGEVSPYAARDAIERALYRTPLGRVVGREPLMAMAKSLCATFGMDDYDEENAPSYTLTTVADVTAQHALRDLLTFAPEGGYDERLGPIGADADGVGFAENGEEYAKLINGDSDGFGGKADGEPLPLLCQPVFYAVLGYKGNGRAFQSRIDALMEAVGLDRDDV